jgi:hypothetical protein
MLLQQTPKRNRVGGYNFLNYNLFILYSCVFRFISGHSLVHNWSLKRTKEELHNIEVHENSVTILKNFKYS